MIPYFYNMTIGNRGGVPFIDATQTSAGSSTADATYTFPNHTFRWLGRQGIIVVNFATAAASTVTGVTISTNDTSLALTSNTGAALTSLAAGTYLVVFNKTANTLQLLNN